MAGRVALLLEHVGARRRLEGEGTRAQRRVDLDLAELQHRALAEAVLDLQRRERFALEADLDALELPVLGLRRGLDPLQAVAFGRRLQREVGLQRRRSGAAAIRAAGVEPSTCACLRA
jgi:hypothetical protein